MGNEFLGRTVAAIEKIVTDLGYECVNVAPVTEDGRSVLRVMIDSIGGINVSDCETVSKAVSRRLDDEGGAELADRYYLEVSSPGVERPLFTPADYERFKGREARVKTAELADGRKIHVGFIVASDQNGVTLDTEQGQRTLPFSAVTRGSLVFRGPEAQKKPQKTQGPQKTKKQNGSKINPRSKTAIEEEL